MTVQPFQINVEQSILDDLHARLERTRWTDEIQGTGWERGADLTYMKSLMDYWRTQFDWRVQERQLNQSKHFRASVDGFGLHFIHEKAESDTHVPILLLHGWPYSFLQMAALTPLLAHPANNGGQTPILFDVVVPSLPGYGFSDRATTRGMNSARVADLLARLMTDELGYSKFVVHGGDVSFAIAQALAVKYPDRVAGLHLTEVGFPYSAYGIPNLTQAEQQFLRESQDWGMREGAYAQVHTTKPQTLALGLNDSPVGLAAWIVEKFHSWSDNTGDIEQRFSKDQLLTNLTVYWATQTIHSSMRIYAESIQAPPILAPGQRIETPAAFALFPKDLTHPPREWSERTFNVQQWTPMPRGGHFPQIEEPSLVADDIRAFVSALNLQK